MYEFLRGEAGLHKLHSGPADDRQRNLARVSVLAVNDQLDSDDPAVLIALLRASERSDGDDAVARVYTAQGRHRAVRDPRTGARVPDVQAVLQEGQIDPFLLAVLRQATEAQPLPQAVGLQ